MISGEESIVVSSRNRTGRKQETVLRPYHVRHHRWCLRQFSPSNWNRSRPERFRFQPSKPVRDKKNEFELKNEKFQKKIPKIFQVTTSLTVSKKIQISVRLV
jgi:hypothetical protein